MSIKYTKSSINLSEQHVHQPVVYQQVNPNLITNGNFNVYQLEHVTRQSLGNPSTRNVPGQYRVTPTNKTDVFGGILYADGWYFGDSGGEAAVTREQFDEFKPDFTDSRYYTRVSVNRGDTNMGLTQKIYGINNMVRGRTVTLSFWARGTIPGGKQTSPWFASVMGYYDIDTDTVWRRDGVETEDNFWLEPYWKKYTMTLHFDFENTPGWTKESGHGDNFVTGISDSFFYVYPIIQRNTDNNTTGDYHYDICDVKLELGPVATPFVQPDPATERMRCFQYVEPLYSRQSVWNTFAIGKVNSKDGDSDGAGGTSNVKDSAGNPACHVMSVFDFKTQKPYSPTIMYNCWTNDLSGTGEATPTVTTGMKVYATPDPANGQSSYDVDGIAWSNPGKNMTRVGFIVSDPNGELDHEDCVHLDIGDKFPSAYAILV